MLEFLDPSLKMTMGVDNSGPTEGVTPTDVANLGARWRAGDLALTDGGAVASWVDSAVSLLASQATVDNQPTYRSSPTGFNGKPAVDFDGVNDTLIVPTNNVSSNKAGLTLFAVCRPDASVADLRSILYLRSTSALVTPRAVLEMNRTAGQFGVTGRRLETDLDQSLAGGDASVAQTNILVAWIDYANSDLTFRVNGLQRAASGDFQTPGTTAETNSRGIILGSSSGSAFFSGLISELLVYTRALLIGEIESLETYLSTEYGVALS